MKIERKWSMPNRWTFKIKPIKQLLDEECTYWWRCWIDPFAGMCSPAQIKNDLNPEMPAKHHYDALKFLRGFHSPIYNGVLYDPPYSFRQATECYKKYGRENLNITNMEYWSKCKDRIAMIIRPGGKCISFGWNSMGLGKNRGFEIKRILLVAHGGSQNDTIVTVEEKNET